MADNMKAKLDIGGLVEPHINPYLKTGKKKWNTDDYYKAQRRAEKLRKRNERATATEECSCTMDTNLANLDPMSRNEIKHVVDGAIDRLGALDNNSIAMILEKHPSCNKGNQASLRKELKKYSANHEREQLAFFIAQNKILVHSCGGLDVVKSAVSATDIPIFQHLITRKFDQNPLACCNAAFGLGSKVIDQEWIWTSESPKALACRKMYRLKFIGLATLTWLCCTQYNNDKTKQAKEKKKLRGYWKRHMSAQHMSRLDLPSLPNMPTRPPHHSKNLHPARGDDKEAKAHEEPDTEEPGEDNSDDDSSISEKQTSPQSTTSSTVSSINTTPAKSANAFAKRSCFSTSPTPPVSNYTQVADPAERSKKRKRHESPTLSPEPVPEPVLGPAPILNTHPPMTDRGLYIPTQPMLPPPRAQPYDFGRLQNYGIASSTFARYRAVCDDYRSIYHRGAVLPQEGGYGRLVGEYGGRGDANNGEDWRQSYGDGFGGNQGGFHVGYGRGYGGNDYGNSQFGAGYTHPYYTRGDGREVSVGNGNHGRPGGYGGPPARDRRAPFPAHYEHASMNEFGAPPAKTIRF